MSQHSRHPLTLLFPFCLLVFGLLFYFIVCLGFEVLWFRSTLIRFRVKVVRTSVLPSFIDVSEMVAGAAEVTRKNL